MKPRIFKPRMKCFLEWSLPLVLALFFTLLINNSIAQTRSVWTETDVSKVTEMISERENVPRNFRAITLNADALRNFMSTVPHESNINVMNSNAQFSLPMPDGSFRNFQVVESPIMEKGLIMKYPDIKTFLGKGVENSADLIRFGWTELGFHAIILASEGAIFVEPVGPGIKEHYIVFHLKDLPVPADYRGCQGSYSPSVEDFFVTPPSLKMTGAQLRTFRLAMAATGEYFAQYGTVAASQAAIVALMNQVNAIYERDVAMRMILIANNDTLIYTDASSDPYTNVGGNPCDANPRAQNVTTLDNVIGNSNFDIGHLVTGTNIGGCASLGGVCGGNKARAVSGVTLGGAFDIGLTAHEMGHQFNAGHTFNSVTGTCGGQLSSSSAYEPGAGTTIMSYAGSCAPDSYQGSRDMFFHTHSYTQMHNFITSGGGSGCVSTQATGNNSPVVNPIAGGFTIPRSTPFTLTGSASDPDGDALTYTWEQYDLGPQGAPNSPSGNAPLFRFFPPTSSPSRTFPQLSDILSNSSTMGETLPFYTRSMTFRLTARDNRAGGGGYDYATTTVDVTGDAGPFTVTSQLLTSILWCAGSTETIKWNVANTTDAPVSTSHVNILLSTDGGQTFPIVLAANTPNDGSQDITVPEVSATTARVKVEAVGNIFFDINSSDFAISIPPTFTTQPSDVNAEWGDNVSFSISYSGNPTPSVRWQGSTDGGATFNNISGGTNSSFNINCVTLDMDGYKFRVVITNICGSDTSNVVTLTVVPRVVTATITVTPNPQQYSDTVHFDVTLADANICGQAAATGADIYVGTQFMGSVTFSASGTSLIGTLASIPLLEPSPYGTAPTGQMAPGLRTVSAVLHDVNANFDVSDPTETLEILPEDARAYYTGACFASTKGTNSSSATITLSATIRDISAELADPAYDEFPGDIRNATLSFINRETNTIIAANVPIGLVDGDPLTAVGTYEWNVNITGNSQTFTIGVIVGGYYDRDHQDDDVLVTVSKPLSDFVTGGGYLVLESPAGVVAGNIGSKHNFGYSVKFNKKGTSLQGNITAMIRKTEADGLHIYKIKSNKLTSLAVQPSSEGGKATINAKASIQDVTDPNNPIAVDGNATLQIKMSDWGEPGRNDSIAITIWNKSGGLWFASNWTGTVTAEQVLAGGNLNVSSNNSFKSADVIAAAEDDLSVKYLSVYPNPAKDKLAVTFNVKEKGSYDLRLIDVVGRTIAIVYINAEAGENITEMEVDMVASGMYNVVLSDKWGINKSERVVILK